MKVAFTYRHTMCNRLFLVLVYCRGWVCFSRRGINFVGPWPTLLVGILINACQMRSDSCIWFSEPMNRVLLLAKTLQKPSCREGRFWGKWADVPWGSNIKKFRLWSGGNRNSIKGSRQRDAATCVLAVFVAGSCGHCTSGTVLTSSTLKHWPASFPFHNWKWKQLSCIDKAASWSRESGPNTAIDMRERGLQGRRDILGNPACWFQYFWWSKR